MESGGRLWKTPGLWKTANSRKQEAIPLSLPVNLLDLVCFQRCHSVTSKADASALSQISRSSELVLGRWRVPQFGPIASVRLKGGAPIHPKYLDVETAVVHAHDEIVIWV
jgi:hypothetical protein